jgi:predicted ArsR family transcriptional regulator
MTTHAKLAQVITLLRTGPHTVDDMAAVVEYHSDGVRRFLRALDKAGHIRPRGVKDWGQRGSKPTLWEWVQ